MSAWKLHAICPACWQARNPGAAIPHRFTDDHTPTVACCFCGAKTGDALVVREKSEAVPCKGICGVDAKAGAPT